MRINVRRTFLLLVSITVFLMLMHFFPENILSRLKDLFNLNIEDNIRLRFRAILLLTIFLIYFLIYILILFIFKLKCNQLNYSKFWIFLSFVFCFLYLFTVFFMLMLVSSENPSSRIEYLFNLNSERNIPTWFSTILLFTISLISFFLSKISVNQLHSRNFWIVFSCVFCFLSLDEAACIHEILDLFIKWVFVYAPLAGAFFIFCIYHLLKIDNKTLRNVILIGLITYATAGLISEAITFLFYPLPPLILELEYVFEEGFEMLGSVILLSGCLLELNRSIKCNKVVG